MYYIELKLEPNYSTLENNQKIKIKDISTGISKLIIKKNSNLFGSNKTNYNLYQIDVQIPSEIYSNLMKYQYIMHLIIKENQNNYQKGNLNQTKKIAETYLCPKEIYYLGVDSTTRLLNVRIIAVNIIVAQMLIDNGIVSMNTQQMLNTFADPTTLSWTVQQPISGKFFDKFIQKTIQDFYGSSCFSKYIGNEFAINNSVAEYFNIPTQLNSIDTIKYILLNIWPYFGIPQFHIDDFFENPQILIKFDEIITSRAEINLIKTFSDINNTTLKRKINSNIFSTTFPSIQTELINDFNLLELKKFSNSTIINSTLNGIKNIKPVFSSHYLYDENNLKYESSAKNPFVTIIQNDLSKYDLEKFIMLASKITSLSMNLKIKTGPIKITDINIGQIIELILNKKTNKPNYLYIYEINFELYKTTETLDNKLHDININNYNVKSTFKAIDITSCPEHFNLTI